MAQAPYELLIGGDTQGSLAPCGCTEPMTGGIRRLATAIHQNRGAGRSGFIENGGLVALNPQNGLVGQRQNTLKLETLAEAYGEMDVDAINLGVEEAVGGAGTVSEVVNLSGQKLISTSLDGPQYSIPRWVVSGPCLIGGVAPQGGVISRAAGGTPIDTQMAVDDLCSEAIAAGKAPVLMIRASEDEAKSIATAHPALRLIVYSALGSAPTAPERVGETLLVTPGSETKNLVKLTFAEGKFSDYSVITLDPGLPDDPKVTRLYKDYLRRVTSAKLIEELPRTATAAYIGSQACLKCHTDSYTIWHASAHAHALSDLEKQGHDRDPDCLRCHVTGLGSKVGFRTRVLTPRLANVTCESCHGPSAAHALDPKKFRLAKAGEEVCLSCHTPENSPGFQFGPFWKKVIHHN